MQELPRLSTLSSGSGCGCKIAPAVLETIIGSQDSIKEYFPDLLVGNSSRDDAAVYRLSDTQALISTTDFFTPIVDDPEDFGKISAANAISDIYAMGGKPLMALAVLGWPTDILPAEMAAKVLAGARQICAEAGIPLAGGHSIQSREPFFGLSVNGLIHPEQIKQNSTPQAGDLLFLTKPLGSGIIAAGLKRELAGPSELNEVLPWLKRLNKSGEIWAQYPWIHAMTDITGFGLLGHLNEMCGERLGAELNFQNIPILSSARTLAAQFIFPDNTWRNWQALEHKVKLEDGSHMPFLSDPQTNGGLLLAIDPIHAEELSVLWEKYVPESECKPIGVMQNEPGIRVR